MNKRFFCALIVTLAGSTSAALASFTAGDLVVFQAGDGSVTLANNSPFSIIELSAAPAQVSPVQSLAVSTDASRNLWCSASATSTGYMSLSENRGSVQFNGIIGRGAASAPFPNANTVLSRAVGSFDQTAAYSQVGSYTGVSGNQTRAGGLMTNGDLFIGDQGGLYANGGGPAAALAINGRNIRSFGGVPYVLQQSSVVTNIVISSIGGTPSSPSVTGLTGLTNNATAVDFYMVASAGDSNYDLLYLSTTAGISKFQNVGGTWTARGTAAVTGGLFGLAAKLDPAGGVDLFATTGAGAGSANTVTEFVDSSAPSANVALGAGTVLFTTPTNTTLKGIEFAPVPTPGSLLLMSFGAVASFRRRR